VSDSFCPEAALAVMGFSARLLSSTMRTAMADRRVMCSRYFSQILGHFENSNACLNSGGGARCLTRRLENFSKEDRWQIKRINTKFR
jgi:hypothetical protein